MKLNWKNETACLIASGPSLTMSQVNYVYGKCKTIAINNNYQIAPWADALYACDAAWWEFHNGAPGFTGKKYSLEQTLFEDVFYLHNSGFDGLDTQWPGIRTGGNGGYQAINLAVHFGVKRIVLIGYDMQRTNGKAHWHGDHPQGLNNAPRVAAWVEHFNGLAPALEQAGVEVINCTLETALTCFEQADLREVL